MSTVVSATPSSSAVEFASLTPSRLNSSSSLPSTRTMPTGSATPAVFVSPVLLAVEPLMLIMPPSNVVPLASGSNKLPAAPPFCETATMSVVWPILAITRVSVPWPATESTVTRRSAFTTISPLMLPLAARVSPPRPPETFGWMPTAPACAASSSKPSAPSLKKPPLPSSIVVLPAVTSV